MLWAASAALAFTVWIGLPTFAAAAMARDNPAWADPDDGSGGAEVVESTSWFPPGVRYEWTGARSGQRRVAVDPWGPGVRGPLLWTALCVTPVLLGAHLLWLRVANGANRARGGT